MIRPIAVAAAAAVLAACHQPDAPIGAGFRPVLELGAEPIKALDILFVVDNSFSMAEHQRALIDSAGDSLFGALAVEAGGVPDLHVAVVSTDLGSGLPIPAGGNCLPGGGDQGRFQIAGGETCGISGAFLSDVDDGLGGRLVNHPGDLAAAFACAAELGAQGCGYEHDLEAMRRALDGSNPENAGFLRDDALLLVVFLTNEDDCSASDPRVLDPRDTATFGPPVDFRCFEFGVVCDGDDPRTLGAKTGCVSREDSPYLHPVERYATFLRTLKSDPSLVMVAGIFADAGPVSVSPYGGDSVALTSICGGATTNPWPAPAVRMHEFGQHFPAHWVFAPICNIEMSANLDRIARSTGGVMSGSRCLLGEVAPNAACRAQAIAPDGSQRALDLVVAEDRERCGYAPQALRAEIAGALAPGERLRVECMR
ncbi:MAG: hypothetical protein KIT31_20345 [Deltaproteobacteria bacterium]|nr:hypothetical protein [Deltaproteobacteria bacterium]